MDYSNPYGYAAPEASGTNFGMILAGFFFLTTITFIILWLFVSSPIKITYCKDPTGTYIYNPDGCPATMPDTTKK